MHVGMSLFFQNLRGVSDERVWLDELALAELAEPLGFESVWSVEHHFTSYTMSPDVLQFLTYMAARTTKVQLGSMVVVLPRPRPMPSTTRPPLTMSSTAICSATRTGSCHGSTTTIEPSCTFVVRAAM